MKKKTIPKPIKFHGGKWYLQDAIRALAAPHRIRVFGCVGGWSEGWNWPGGGEGVGEIINDLDGWLINFYEVLADEKMSKKLIRKLQLTPFSEAQWQKSTKIVETWGRPDRERNDINRVEGAYHYFMHMRLSMAGRGDSFAPSTSSRLRNDMLEQVSAYLGAIDGLPEASVRLSRVMIRNVDVCKLIATLDKPDVWFYLDPTYHPDTRVSKTVYRHEMSAEDHDDLLLALSNLKHAKFLLSGYDCPSYRKAKKANGWNSISIMRPNASSSKKKKDDKREVFWANYELPKLG